MNNLIKQATACGFEVWLAESGTYGFITNGDRVLSFECHRYRGIKVSGNYAASRLYGTGWVIEDEIDDSTVTGHDIKTWLHAPAPGWANLNPVYTTRDQHLARYGASSKYRMVS